MKPSKQQHPVDTLARALDRASGLLGTMGDLYDPTTETFSGGNTFLVHALSTASTLIVDARAALEDIHYRCDLTLLDETQVPDSSVGLSTMDATTIEPEVDADWHSEINFDRHSAAPAAISVTTENDDDEPFAQSYLELLRKLTAAEVFAAEQQALSAPGTAPELLPLLRSLREDLQKIHNAA